MTQLAEQIGMSGSGLTRLIDRLQDRGLVERRRCAADGRGYEASLTAAGRNRLRRLHVIHLRAVRELFLSRLTPAEQQSLAAIWQRLADSPATGNTKGA
jgi:DNA-binding MarR family transcriptional regulator